MNVPPWLKLHAATVSLVCAGIASTVLGLFVERDALATAFVVLGSGEFVLGVLLSRMEGPFELSLGGIKGTLFLRAYRQLEEEAKPALRAEALKNGIEMPADVVETAAQNAAEDVLLRALRNRVVHLRPGESLSPLVVGDLTEGVRRAAEAYKRMQEKGLVPKTPPKPTGPADQN